MPIPEQEREIRSNIPFVIPCLSCGRPTSPQYSYWEIQLLREHEEVDVVVTCDSCKKRFSYIPATKKMTDISHRR